MKPLSTPRSKGKSRGRHIVPTLLAALILIYSAVSFWLPVVPGADSAVISPLVDTDTTTAVSSNKAAPHAAHGASLIADPFDQIRDRAHSWLQALPQHYDTAQYTPNMRYYRHDRFLPFTPMASCKDMQEVGRLSSKTAGFDDVSKMVCGMSDLKTADDCIIYSIGGNNQWAFEQELLRLTNCQVHTFDCTGPRSRFQVPQHERLYFHHKCLGSQPSVPADPCTERSVANAMCGPLETLQQLQASLGHTRLDLLKMDIEGFEIALLKSWWANQREGESTYVYPNQMLMELHYRAYPSMFAQLVSPLVLQHKEDNLAQTQTFEFATAIDFVTLGQELLELGYIIVSRDDNTRCKHCSELVLVRVADSLY